MTLYWDTSALINAVVSEEVRTRLDSGNHYTRPHTLCEFFAIMTGRGIIAEEAGVKIRIKLSAKDAAAWLTEVAPKLKPVEISFDETLSSIADCEKDGVMGGAIHDYMHGRACEKSKSDALLTRNTKCLPITALVQRP